MKIRIIGIICLIFLISFCICDESRGVNGGMNCAVCTIVTGIIQQTAYIKGVSIFEAAKKFCKKIPGKVQEPCFETITALESLLTDKRFLNLFTPDIFCYALRSCHVDAGESFCHLFPKPHISFQKASNQLKKILDDYGVDNILRKLYIQPKRSNIRVNKISVTNFLYSDDISYNDQTMGIDFCKMPVLKTICDVFLGTFGDLKPAVDLDGDGFSILQIARGSDWRGKDCSDIDPFIYPGAQTKNSDIHMDTNCNGIWGEDPESGRPWEELLCSETGSQGLIYLGDSIGAHFHFPESWMNPTLNDSSSIASIIEALLDELDWPELGFATGFMNSTHPNLIEGLTDSIYLRLRARNLCSHRDYQNGARNAAMSWDGMREARAISKNPSDKPALVIYAMMGNDVCNRFRDTIGNMTKPDKFRELVIETLSILDKALPLHSTVILISLLDGSFIYPTMAERVHPLGSVLNNIRYKNVYSWFSCMQIGPCEGWMTPNTTLQKITTQKAYELSNVLKDIAMKSKFTSFKVHYLKNPFNTAIEDWVTKGGHIYELIDPIDSTHPNQKAQPLLAGALWDSLQKIGVLGSINPNNEKIKMLFGNQGGH